MIDILRDDLRHLFLTTLFVGAFTPFLCHGHDWPVHMRITTSAFGSSSGLQTFLGENLESQILTASQPQISGGFAPIAWLAQGSYFEDEQIYFRPEERTPEHFYTVTTQRIAGQTTGLTDADEPWYNIFGLPSGLENSFAWATHFPSVGPLDVGLNDYQWVDAREYQYVALTSANQSDRNENMALMLYTMGHILHLNQDLSQPDHTRNDNHFSKAWIEDYGLAQYAKNPQWFNLQSHGWKYWQDKGYSKLLDFWDRGHYTGDASALDADASGSDKLGLAEFSNGNFLGEDAVYNEIVPNRETYHKFPYPSLDKSTNIKDVQKELVDGLHLVFPADVSYLRNGQSINRLYIAQNKGGHQHGQAINHQSALCYLGVKANPYAGAFGNYYQVSTGITINDPTVLKDYHSVLIPKAVEYSAGILDYFFRGTLDVNLANNLDGTVGLTIINTSSQDFKGGAFHLFYDDINGFRTELTGDNFSTEYSDSLAPNASTTATFTAPDNGVKYILVYKGTIGTTGVDASDPVDKDIAIAVKNFDMWSHDEDNWDETFSLTAVGNVLNFNCAGSSDDSYAYVHAECVFYNPTSSDITVNAVLSEFNHTENPHTPNSIELHGEYLFARNSWGSPDTGPRNLSFTIPAHDSVDVQLYLECEGLNSISGKITFPSQ